MTSQLVINRSPRWKLLAEVDAYIASQARYATGEIDRPLEFSRRLFCWLGIPSEVHDLALLPTKRDATESLEVRTSLLRLLQSMAPEPFSYTDEASVLLGLSRQGWEGCLGTTTDARLLALAILRYIVYYSPHYVSSRATAPPIINLLNTWCLPTEKWKVLPAVGDVCQYLFGDVWCHFHLPAQDSDRNTYMTELEKFFTRRPDFLPGLCADSDALFLPDDLGSAS
jgi:hypothetical protein